MRKIPVVGKFLMVVVVSLLAVVAARAIQTPAQTGLPTPQGPPTVTPRGQLGGAIALPTKTPLGTVRTPTPRPSPPPGSAECQVEPRTIDELLALAPVASTTSSPDRGGSTATSAASIGSAPTPTASTLPTATAVSAPASDSSVVGQIQATATELIACSNAGELLSVWALFTDDFVTRAAAAQGELFNASVLAARSQVQSIRHDPVPTVTNVQSLGNGRFSARISLPEGSLAAEVAGEGGSTTVVFVQQEGRWLIDEVS